MESSQSADMYLNTDQDLDDNHDLYREISYMLSEESSSESSPVIEELDLESSSSLEQTLSFSPDEYEEDPIVDLTGILPCLMDFRIF